MKNCSLLNRIVPQARQSLRNFTNESAENLGTKLWYGHTGTIEKPVIARRITLPANIHRSDLHTKVSSCISPQPGVPALVLGVFYVIPSRAVRLKATSRDSTGRNSSAPACRLNW